MPQKIPRVADIGIRRILRPWLPTGFEIRPHDAAPHGQEGSQERQAVAKFACRRHAGEAGETGAAEAAVQDRFRLVVGGMCDDDSASAVLVGDVDEKLLPQPSRPSLDSLATDAIRLATGEIAHDARDAKPSGQIHHEGGIGHRLLAEIMPGMRHHQPRACPLPRSQAVQPKQERHAIGAAGDGHHHRRRPEAVLRQPGGKGCQEIAVCHRCGGVKHGHGTHSRLGFHRNEIDKLGEPAD